MADHTGPEIQKLEALTQTWAEDWNGDDETLLGTAGDWQIWGKIEFRQFQSGQPPFLNCRCGSGFNMVQLQLARTAEVPTGIIHL